MVTIERVISRGIEPFEAWRRLRGNAPSVFLDGVTGGTRSERAETSRRAYVLFDPVRIVTLGAASDRDPKTPDPLRMLFAELERHVGPAPTRRIHDAGAVAPVAPRFRGGAAGLFGYDLGRRFEHQPDTALIRSAAPDLWFGIFDRGLEIDLETGAVIAFVTLGVRGGAATHAEAESILAEVERRLEAVPSPLSSFRASALRSNFERSRYIAAVESVREYIRAGDVYQINLAQRFEAEFEGDFAAAYAALRATNPAPFSALIDTTTTRVLSSSPELFLAVDGDRVETRPIKGTRRRTGDPGRDAVLEAELMASRKERSELAMVIDLERNDLCKASRVGAVRVRDEGRLERYAEVVHRTAIVDSVLRDDKTLEDLLRGAFPGGSITGVPKIRAMEIIEEIEGVRRQVFTGSIGFLGFDGSAELSITIRTLVVEEDRVHFHVGGGVVLASEAEAEFEETLAKGSALARALGRTL